MAKGKRKPVEVSVPDLAVTDVVDVPDSADAPLTDLPVPDHLADGAADSSGEELLPEPDADVPSILVADLHGQVLLMNTTLNDLDAFNKDNPNEGLRKVGKVFRMLQVHLGNAYPEGG